MPDRILGMSAAEFTERVHAAEPAGTPYSSLGQSAPHPPQEDESTDKRVKIDLEENLSDDAKNSFQFVDFNHEKEKVEELRQKIEASPITIPPEAFAFSKSGLISARGAMSYFAAEYPVSDIETKFSIYDMLRYVYFLEAQKLSQEEKFKHLFPDDEEEDADIDNLSLISVDEIQDGGENGPSREEVIAALITNSDIAQNDPKLARAIAKKLRVPFRSLVPKFTFSKKSDDNEDRDEDRKYSNALNKIFIVCNVPAEVNELNINEIDPYNVGMVVDSRISRDAGGAVDRAVFIEGTFELSGNFKYVRIPLWKFFSVFSDTDQIQALLGSLRLYFLANFELHNYDRYSRMSLNASDMAKYYILGNLL